MRIDVATYQRVLGDEIRRLRKQRGWTRKELNTRLQSDISLQTLATYELGTRQCSVVRFVEICVALDALPHDLMARVHDRVFADTPIGRVRVDLKRAVDDRAPELMPLRRWAAELLAENQGQTEVHLDLSALDRLAELCGMDTADLIGRLRQLSA
ncbi:helix-turn-helix transcriptional regulator [Actinokineospora sp. NBRC 105648]|uniref:helix-turn-helix domain-containing protein n=1 Tax=Actinokineospora sp. NBRC 105648 TaxID=3032206 RepID=UPI0024A1F0F7|nr:helix-turn-helix transcriptional regulator [Actinokineospora sp. NBRC 105648]GLZ41056.1 transcriptional regulator [Actinokineospora sp. NBRC 105648]